LSSSKFYLDFVNLCVLFTFLSYHKAPHRRLGWDRQESVKPFLGGVVTGRTGRGLRSRVFVVVYAGY
jgi:hypothetical protein